MSLQGVNPKDALAVREDKAPLDFLEPAGDEGIARALKFGGDKYGRRNYLQTPVLMSVYIGAMQRHINALKRGEDFAADSGCHHADHIGANVHIIKAAGEHGTLVDDRVLPPRPEPEVEPCPCKGDCIMERSSHPDERRLCPDFPRETPPHPDSWEATRDE